MWDNMRTDRKPSIHRKGLVTHNTPEKVEVWYRNVEECKANRESDRILLVARYAGMKPNNEGGYVRRAK